MTNLYETLLIVAPEVDEEGVDAVLGDLRTQVEAGDGRVLQASVWGRRQLAYQVQGRTEGTFAILHSEGPATLPQQLKERMRLDESVIRNLVVRLEDEQEAAARKQAEEHAAQQTAAAAQQHVASERRAAAAVEAAARSVADVEAGVEDEAEPGEVAAAAGEGEGGEEAVDDDVEQEG
ncbi:MAG: 30S ribosomal protein S6 [Acidobacteriota bacterium]